MDTLPTDGWSLEDERPPAVEVSDPVEASGIPYIADPKAWRQYCDEEVYWADSRLREFLEEASKNRRWARSQKLRKYTMAMMFEILTGRKYQPSDRRVGVKLARVMAYYSTRIMKGTSIDGKKTNKKVYVLSARRLERQPYSLKLRMEMVAARGGELPLGWGYGLCRDNLKAGHARNKRTDANMARRREKARKAYNERYADRNH